VTRAEIERMIVEQRDISRLLELAELPSGGWLYLIETPFQTFPKFVVGELDAAGELVRLRHRCGTETVAREAWLKEVRP
jgi:hypothetical protein